MRLFTFALALAPALGLPGPELAAQALIGTSLLIPSTTHLTVLCESNLDAVALAVYHNDQCMISHANVAGDGKNLQLAKPSRMTPAPHVIPVGPTQIRTTFAKNAEADYRLDTTHGIWFIPNMGCTRNGKKMFNFWDPLGFSGRLFLLAKDPSRESGTFEAGSTAGTNTCNLSVVNVGRTYYDCKSNAAAAPTTAPAASALSHKEGK